MSERIFDVESVVSDIHQSMADGVEQIGSLIDLKVEYPFGRSVPSSQIDSYPIAKLELDSKVGKETVYVSVGVYFDCFGFKGVEISARENIDGKIPKRRKAKKALAKVAGGYVKAIAELKTAALH
jgi:hypothetical protein